MSRTAKAIGIVLLLLVLGLLRFLGVEAVAVFAAIIIVAVALIFGSRDGLTGWFPSLLAKLSREAPPVPDVDHPVFGRIYASHRPRAGPWLWETLKPITHQRGEVSVTWLADENGPTQAQVNFWLWLQENIDAVVAEAMPLLAIDIEEWTERPVPADPWQEIIWEGAGLPARDRNDEWDVSFATRTCPDVMLTVNYQSGKPAYVTTDD